MTIFIIYIIKVNIIFTLFTILYYSFFRNLTFYGLNRLVLLGTLFCSLLIPCLDINLPFLDGNKSEADFKQTFLHKINDIKVEKLFESPSSNKYASTTPLVTAESPKSQIIDPIKSDDKVSGKSVFSLSSLFKYIYIIGGLISLYLLIKEAAKIVHNRLTSQKIYSFNFISVVKSKIDHVFSSFKWVFLPEDYNFRKEDPVIKHEIAHIKLKHSYDLLLTEIFVIINWMNPFVYIFRNQLKELHEYQADKYVLSSNIKKSDYLTLMLESVLGTNRPNLASGFSSSGMKKRINMIMKNKSSSIAILRYSIILPLFALLLMSFSVKRNIETKKAIINTIEQAININIQSEIISRTYFDEPQKPFQKKKKIDKKNINKVVAEKKERYKTMNIEGFSVMIENKAFDEDFVTTLKAYDRLKKDLKRIARSRINKEVLNRLQTIKIFLDWNTVKATSSEISHIEKEIQNNLYFRNVKEFNEYTNQRHMPFALLHSLSYTYYNKFLTGEEGNSIRESYKKEVIENNKYSNLTFLTEEGEYIVIERGLRKSPVYYFAASTIAFMGISNSYPFNYRELQTYDPNMYDIMTDIWGKNIHHYENNDAFTTVTGEKIHIDDLASIYI